MIAFCSVKAQMHLTETYQNRTSYWQCLKVTSKDLLQTNKKKVQNMGKWTKCMMSWFAKSISRSAIWTAGKHAEAFSHTLTSNTHRKARRCFTYIRLAKLESHQVLERMRGKEALSPAGTFWKVILWDLVNSTCTSFPLLGLHPLQSHNGVLQGRSLQHCSWSGNWRRNRRGYHSGRRWALDASVKSVPVSGWYQVHRHIFKTECWAETVEK